MDTIAGTLKQLKTYEPMALIQFWLKRLGPVLKGCIEVLHEDKVKRKYILGCRRRLIKGRTLSAKPRDLLLVIRFACGKGFLTWGTC